MTITAKFDGRCKDCGGKLAAGTAISWSRDGGARHTSSAQCDAVRAERAAADVAAAQAAPVLGSSVSIVAFLAGAKAHGLKFPKARFLAPDGRSEMRLAIAGERSRYQGAINVVIADEFVGRINVDGTASTGLAQRADVVAVLEAVAADPAAAAKAYGALMCRCSFCNLALTDEGSVEVGYGPICAKRWGLPHTAKGTPGLLAVPVEGDTVAA